MSEFTQGILTALIPALIVSIIAPYITVKLSIKQFYSQKWWEKKAEVYSHIIEQLSYLQYYFGEWYDIYLYQKELNNEEREKLSEGYRKAKESITKAAASGAYIVSDDTGTALEKLVSELDQEDPRAHPLENVEREYNLIKKCIATIRKCAKADLKNK